MRPLGGALVIGMALACLAVPARAQDDDGTAEEAAPPRAREPSESDEGTATEATGESNGQEAAAARAARRARIRAARAARRQAALEREAAAQAEAEAKAPVAPTGTAPAKAEAPAEARPASGSEERAAPGPAALPAETGRLDVKSLDTLPAAAATHEEPPAAAPVFHAPPARGEHAVEQITEGGAGEEGTHPAFSVKAFILQLINFGVLLFLLIYWGGRAFNKLLRTRHEQLRTEIGEATRVRDQAKRKFEAQERRLAELEKEIADLRAAMRKDAEAEQARLLQAAQERGQRIQDEMRAQVEEQVKLAEAALRAEVANASVKLAEDMVRQAVSFEDERRLAREFVAGFGKPGTPSPDEEVR